MVDSIVRQSRHQFGSDKDVFGPRFTKNITGTFENLCLCPVEDRVRPERVGEDFTVNMNIGDSLVVTNSTKLLLKDFPPCKDKGPHLNQSPVIPSPSPVSLLSYFPL